MNRYKIGIDVGGTFTDGVLLNETTGEIVNMKVSSTPKDPSIGFLENLDRLHSKAAIRSAEHSFLVHGTTVATNAIIEGKTAKTAFITTEGFRDLLEIQFQIRPKLYDVFVEKPAPLIQRNLCFEVKERIGPEGEIIEALDEEQVTAIAKQLVKERVESVAVCLLHSYVNGHHEKKIRNLLAVEFPDLPVTLSSELCPTFREYPRASTTCINACILPIVGRYVERIEGGLKQRGMSCEWYLMQSNGGVLRSDIAAKEPCRIIESGPAAGVIVASYIARQLGKSNVMCLDMGGTTAKIGMILNGEPSIASEFEVGAAAFSRSTARRASGYPLRTPSIDLIEIGAGGGSIAWVDSGGILRVGPQSAGADPGPACYPSGGKEPTITDANLVLGRLNPDYFLGGEMKLNMESAEKAIQIRCSEKLKFSLSETAAGIIDVAVSNMVNAIRFVSVERGYDPREFCLITTGGAGPLHANLIADELNIPQVIIPPNPGVASALGLLLTDVKQEVSRTVINLKGLDSKTVRGIIDDLVEEVRVLLKTQGVANEQMEFYPYAEMRYAGQSYELNVPIEFDGLETLDWAVLQEGFNQAHNRAYGFSVKNEETVVVNLKVTGVGKIRRHNPRTIQSGRKASLEGARKNARNVYFKQEGDRINCAIYERKRLLSGNTVPGPAIVEEVDSTMLILPRYEAKVDKYGNMIISKI